MYRFVAHQSTGKEEEKEGGAQTNVANRFRQKRSPHAADGHTNRENRVPRESFAAVTLRNRKANDTNALRRRSQESTHPASRGPRGISHREVPAVTKRLKTHFSSRRLGTPPLERHWLQFAASAHQGPYIAAAPELLVVAGHVIRDGDTSVAEGTYEGRSLCTLSHSACWTVRMTAGFTRPTVVGSLKASEVWGYITRTTRPRVPRT